MKTKTIVDVNSDGFLTTRTLSKYDYDLSDFCCAHPHNKGPQTPDYYCDPDAGPLQDPFWGTPWDEVWGEYY